MGSDGKPKTNSTKFSVDFALSPRPTKSEKLFDYSGTIEFSWDHVKLKGGSMVLLWALVILGIA